MMPVVALLMVLFAASVANAQAGRDFRGDGRDARTDALLGTPNKAIRRVPQTNPFPTSPGVHQEAPGPSGRDSSKGPNAPSTESKP